MWAVPLTLSPRFLLTLLQINAEDTTISNFITYSANYLYSLIGRLTLQILPSLSNMFLINNKKEFLLALMKDIHVLLLRPSHLLEKGFTMIKLERLLDLIKKECSYISYPSRGSVKNWAFRNIK